jgi:hypothetical protein
MTAPANSPASPAALAAFLLALVRVAMIRALVVAGA